MALVSPRRLTIVHLVPALDAGGAERSLANLVSRLDPTRFRNVVVSMTGRGVFAESIERAGVPVHTLGLQRGRPSVRALWRLRQLLRQEAPAVLQTWLYHADLLGLIASGFGRSVNLVWNVRCSDLALGQYRVLTRCVLWLLVRFSSAPRVVLSNSEAGRRHHVALGYRARHWQVIPNGFDPEIWRPDPAARASIRQQLGVAPQTLLIGLVARRDPMKDHGNFLAAAARVLAAHPGCRFVLVGAGSVALHAEIADSALRAACLSLDSHPAVPQITAAFDVACLSSAWGEACPNVVGEAMACGVPCVATAVGDAALLLGDTGRLVPPQNPAHLARALLEMLALTPAQRVALGLRARARILEHYALARTVAAYAALYERLGASAHPADPSAPAA
ncbi:MAG: glycosyltransferase [Gammaproteobacteria bacterium]|nr:glycosyltransferase [Gammaproteobacteria bacterium]